MHLQVLCHFMCLVSLVLDIKLNTLTFKYFTVSGIQIFAYGSLMLLQLPFTFTYLNTKRIKQGIIAININNFRSYFIFLIIY